MKPFTPQFSKMPKRTVLTVTTVGDPNTVTKGAMQALYGTAFGTKFKVYKPKGKEMKIGAPSAFWFDAHKKPRSKWTAQWLLEVPAFVKQKELVQKVPAMPVKVAKFPAATIAEILHLGSYASEGPTIQKLHAFVKDGGYRLTGPHEEVYLSRPGPKARTLIRYAVAKRRR